MGESIRKSLQAHPSLKKDPLIAAAILDVLRHRNLRRGRESFVMALGYVGASAHAPALVALIGDHDICGHVVDTLLKMRVGGYGREVAPLAGHKQAWVRRLAKRYVERYAI